VKLGLIRAAAVLFCAATTSWLVRYEAFPELFTSSIRGYSRLLRRDVLVSDSWMKVKYGGRDVGYTHTGIDTADDGGEDSYLLSNRTDLNVTLMGQPQSFYAAGTAALDAAYRLRKFAFNLTAGALRVAVSGRRAEGAIFDVTLDTGGEIRNMRVEIPDDVVIHSPTAFLALRRLRPGQEMSLAALDPLTLKKTAVRVKAVGVERVAGPEGPVEATVLSAAYQGMQFRTWIDAKGNILRQESPLGWVAEKCTREEALAAAAGTGKGVELLEIITGRLLAPES